MVLFGFWCHHVHKSALKALKSLRKKWCLEVRLKLNVFGF
jgi:hypothetical protein